MTTIEFYAILPLIFLVAWASILLLLDLFITRKVKGLTAILAALGLGITLVLAALQLGAGTTAFNGMIEADGFSSFLQKQGRILSFASLLYQRDGLNGTGR